MCVQTDTRNVTKLVLGKTTPRLHTLLFVVYYQTESQDPSHTGSPPPPPPPPHPDLFSHPNPGNRCSYQVDCIDMLMNHWKTKLFPGPYSANDGLWFDKLSTISLGHAIHTVYVYVYMLWRLGMMRTDHQAQVGRGGVVTVWLWEWKDAADMWIK